jgi:glyoxylase-like metal-dependent hydrolase (beta-lactamase superfamily II)
MPQLPTGPSDYVASRRAGDATVTVISDASLHWAPRFPVPETEWRAAMPEADAAGRVAFGLNVVLIQTPDAVVLVDPALDDPGSAFDAEFSRSVGVEIVRSPGFAAALRELGVASGSVDHVVITHAHGDHYAGVTFERDGEPVVRFPNARHWLGRADWEGNLGRAQATSELNRRLGAVERLGLLELVDGEREIAPDVALLPSPGESPGHLAVRLRSAGESVYVVGDLIHHACEVEHADWAPAGRDLTALRASRDRLFAEIADSGALAVSAHEPFPAWGRIVSTTTGYRWERA